MIDSCVVNDSATTPVGLSFVSCDHFCSTHHDSAYSASLNMTHPHVCYCFSFTPAYLFRPHLLHRISVAEEGIDHYSSIAIPATFKKLSNHNQPISDATKTIKLMGRLSEIVTELIELRKVLATIRNDLCVRVGRAEGREAAETLPSGVPVAVNIPTTSEMSVLTDVEVGENTPEVIVIDN